MKKNEHQLSAKVPSNIEIGNKIGFDLSDLFIFDENGNRLKSQYNLQLTNFKFSTYLSKFTRKSIGFRKVAEQFAKHF